MALHNGFFIALGALATAAAVLYTRRTLKAMREENDRQAFLMIVGIMEKVRENRIDMREWIEAKRSVITLDPDQKHEAEQLCRAYDTLGLLDRLHLVERTVVDEFYSSAFDDLYEGFIRDYLATEHRERHRTAYWEVRELYKRTKLVRENHPAITGKAWPKNPRERRVPIIDLDPDLAKTWPSLGVLETLRVRSRR